jgi:hypothetical protein
MVPNNLIDHALGQTPPVGIEKEGAVVTQVTTLKRRIATEIKERQHRPHRTHVSPKPRFPGSETRVFRLPQRADSQPRRRRSPALEFG